MEKNFAAQVAQPLPQYNWPEKIDSEWQDRMVMQYAPMIKYIANRIALRLPSHVSMDDLISSGMMGLLDAIQKFDPRRSIDFKTYAEFRIRGAILDELRSLDWIPRSVRKKTTVIEKAYANLQKELGRPAEAEEVAASLELSLEEFYHLLDETKTVALIDINALQNSISELPEDEMYQMLQDEKYRDPFISVFCAELREVIMGAIESLPDKDKLLISLYYYEELTMKEIGEIMGYTESRISQKHSHAIAQLRSKLFEYYQKL